MSNSNELFDVAELSVGVVNTNSDQIGLLEKVISANVDVMPLKEVERVAIERALRAFDGNKVKTAGALGISVKTLYNKLNRYSAEDSGL